MHDESVIRIITSICTNGDGKKSYVLDRKKKRMIMRCMSCMYVCKYSPYGVMKSEQDTGPKCGDAMDVNAKIK